METYQAKPYVERKEIYQLAQSLNISEQKIRQWFKNKRYGKWRKGPVHMCE